MDKGYTIELIKDTFENSSIILVKFVLDKKTGIKNTEPKEFKYGPSNLIYVTEGKFKARGFGILDIAGPELQNNELVVTYAIYSQIHKNFVKPYIESVIKPALAFYWLNVFGIAKSVDKSVNEIFHNKNLIVQ